MSNKFLTADPTNVDLTAVYTRIGADEKDLASHEADLANPHAVTATQIGLDTSDDLKEGSTNLYYTEGRVSANTSVADNTAKRSYPSGDESKLAGIEAGADVTDATNVASAGALMTTGGTMTGSIAMGANNITTSGLIDGRSVSADGGALDSHIANTTGNPHAVTAVQVGISSTDNITEGVSNLYYTEGRVSANSTVSTNAGNIATNSSAISTNGASITALESDIKSYLPLTGGTMTGTIAMGANNITLTTGLIDGRDVSADGIVLDNVSSTYLDLGGGTLIGTLTGRNIQPSLSNVYNLGTALLRWNDLYIGDIDISGTVDGRDIAADGKTLDAVATTYLPLSGGTMTGGIAMGSNNITTSGFVDGRDVSVDGSQLDTNTTAISNRLPLSGGTITGDLTVNGELNVGGAKVPVGALSGLQLYGTNNSMAGPHIQIHTTSDGYPLFQQLNYSHDNVNLAFDAYFDGAWYSSDAGSNFVFMKSSDTFTLRTDSGITPGSALTWDIIASWTPAGIMSSRTINPITTNTYDLGSSSSRWNDLYIGDINASGDIAGLSGTYGGNARVSGRMTRGLQIKGPNGGTTSGSALEIYIADDYPAQQMWAFNHDNIHLCFDSYYYSGFTSSDAGSNFRLSKGGDVLSVISSTGITAGSAISSSITNMHWNTAGSTVSRDIYPSTDDLYDLGTGALRFDDIFATNDVIQTSDARQKENIVQSDLGLHFINSLKPKRFKFKKGKRPHYGLLAQEVEETIVELKTDFAGFVKGSYDVFEKLEVKDEATGEMKTKDGNKIGEEEYFGLRMGEFIAPMIRAIQELSEKNSILEARITALESL